MSYMYHVPVSEGNIGDIIDGGGVAMSLVDLKKYNTFKGSPHLVPINRLHPKQSYN